MDSNWKNIIEINRLSRDMQLEHWLNETLFTFNWWLLLITSLISIIIWFVVVDKRRILEIVTFGLIIFMIAFTLDVAGDFFVLWHYKNTVIPLPTIMEIHTIQIPVIFMIIYQYFNKWGKFLIAITITAFIFAFILEPLLVWLEIYELYNWKYIYSFFPYILIGVICKYIVERLKQQQR